MMHKDIKHSQHIVFKCEAIKEEINEEESVEDPLSIQSENENKLCEFVKVESVKKKMNEVESVEYPLSIQGETTKYESDNKVEIKEEVIDDDPLCVQEIIFKQCTSFKT